MFFAGTAAYLQSNSGAVISNTSAFPYYKCTVCVDNLEAIAVVSDENTWLCVSTRGLCNLGNWTEMGGGGGGGSHWFITSIRSHGNLGFFWSDAFIFGSMTSGKVWKYVRRWWEISCWRPIRQSVFSVRHIKDRTEISVFCRYTLLSSLNVWSNNSHTLITGFLH